MNFDPEFDGGLTDRPIIDEKNESSTTRQAIESVELSSLEYYVTNNSLDFENAISDTMKINLNLYRYISNHFNILKRDGDSPGSMIRFNSIILNMGVKVFNERIDLKQFDKLLLKESGYADGCALSEFETDHARSRLDKPGYVFEDVYGKNWNQRGGTISTNYYKDKLVNTKIANIRTFGFTGRSGLKLTREFMLLLGLRQSETLSETSRAYENVINITDATLDIFEQLIEGV